MMINTFQNSLDIFYELFLFILAFLALTVSLLAIGSGLLIISSLLIVVALLNLQSSQSPIHGISPGTISSTNMSIIRRSTSQPGKKQTISNAELSRFSLK
ncbi:hypothetical protein IFR05_016555 [Cadophora sp. M221]|nr:hypothetical protein IFR05_016555 [Cadophora sp. M221]